MRQELSKVVLVQAMKENGGIAPHFKPQTSNMEVSGQPYAPSALPAEKALLVPNKINGEWALKARMDVLQKIKLFLSLQAIEYLLIRAGRSIDTTLTVLWPFSKWGLNLDMPCKLTSRVEERSLYNEVLVQPNLVFVCSQYRCNQSAVPLA